MIGRFHVDPADVPRWIAARIGTDKRVEYYLAKWLGRPRLAWQRAEVRRIYAEAKRQRAAGLEVRVDHDLPLVSDWVCGLHVPANLKILTVSENARKGNGPPNGDLFTEPEQLALY